MVNLVQDYACDLLEIKGRPLIICSKVHIYQFLKLNWLENNWIYTKSIKVYFLIRKFKCKRSTKHSLHQPPIKGKKRPCQARNQPKIMGGAQSKILDLLRQFW